jgi:hypothetical protein
MRDSDQSTSGKGKVIPVLFINSASRHEGVLGSECIAPRILDLGTRWKWALSFNPRGKSPWYPLEWRLGGPQSRSERGGEEENSQPLPRLEPPIIQPVAQRYTTELSRLRKCSVNWPDPLPWGNWPYYTFEARKTKVAYFDILVQMVNVQIFSANFTRIFFFGKEPTYFLVSHIARRCDFTLKMEAVRSCETLLSHRNSTRHHNPEGLNLKQTNLLADLI